MSTSRKMDKRKRSTGSKSSITIRKDGRPNKATRLRILAKAADSKKVWRPQVPQHLVTPLRAEWFAQRLERVFPHPRNIADTVLCDSMFTRYNPGETQDEERLHKAATEKWLAVEEKNLDTNSRLASVPSYHHWAYRGYLYLAARKIHRLLGPLTPDKVFEGCGFGPGATLTLKRAEAGLHNKVVSPECTIKAYEYWRITLGSYYPGWLQLLASSCKSYLPCSGARMTSVPKNSKTNRMIGIEPVGNMFLQKGVGAYIRRRLKRVGVDLNDQSLNQEAARYGSVMNTLATLDLSSASDTVSYGIVGSLLPPDWLSYLDAIRTEYAELDGVEIKLEKFSAMGNGFTFELESLIFWALVSAVIEAEGIPDTTLLVYGDDIICSVEAVPHVEGLFDYCGFILNKEKSYTDGPFRESCGGYYYDGRCVKPVYLRKPVETHAELFVIHNALSRWLERHPESACDRAEFARLLLDLRGNAEKAWQYKTVPLHSELDVAFVNSTADRLWDRDIIPANNGEEGYLISGLMEVAATRGHRDDAGLLSCLIAMEGLTDRRTHSSWLQWDVRRDTDRSALTNFDPEIHLGMSTGNGRTFFRVGRLRVGHWQAR